MSDQGRNPAAELLKLLDNFGQPWLWTNVARHLAERDRWLQVAATRSPAQAGPKSPAQVFAPPPRDRLVEVNQDSEDPAVRAALLHAENYRRLVVQRVFEYQRAAELLIDAAPELSGELPAVDFFATPFPECAWIGRLQALAAQIRLRIADQM